MDFRTRVCLQDVAAVAYLLDPEAFTLEPFHCEVDLKGRYTFGMCVVDICRRMGAKTMFCRTIRSVFREIFMARAILEGLSSISTMSAASMAASEPMAPMAMPMSARVSTGASLMPSPTKASLPVRSFRSAGST